MATEDLKTFIEDRLQALDPSLDLSPGSPAQVQFIEPLLARLGTDPIDTDILNFILDRFAQEFPDLYTGDPSVIRDTLINPLIILFEPFKREIATLKSNQSLKDPSLLSDEDADALVANIFEDRSSGGAATGVVRVFYSNPTNAQIEVTTRFFTSDGLNFFPIAPTFISAEEMVFNRSGTLFYGDVSVQAEQEGTNYNISENSIIGVEGLFGPIKVSNTRAFTDGSTRLDTVTFVAEARQALTERSLVTRRGAAARINSVFQNDVRAVQLVGAGDVEMQRDILVATSPGQAWAQGTVNLYTKVAYVQVNIIDGDPGVDVPQVGDTLYVYLSPTSYPGILQSQRFVRLNIEQLIIGPLTNSAPFQVSYLLRFSGTFPTTVANPVVLPGGLIRKGTIQISSIPGVGATNQTVNNGVVHVYGHADVYIRPILQTISKASISGIFDHSSFIERSTLATNSNNRVSDAGIDFSTTGVVAGDMIAIETGDDAGNYVIGQVSTNDLYLNANLTASQAGLRYRVIKSIKLDPFEPKILKFPFGSVLANDLTTTIGSAQVTVTSDLVTYGVAAGDTLRILTGTDVGDYLIEGFDAVLGGRGPVLNKKLGGSNSGLTYQIFTAQSPVGRPLVRVKQVLLLDSGNRSTGVTVPPAKPIAIVPTSSFSSAKVLAGSKGKTGCILPDFTSYVLGTNVAATVGDRRYSLGFDPFTGIYKDLTFLDATHAEFDFRADANGTCSYFVATSEITTDANNFPPIDPKSNDCLTIKSGPNRGSYLIDQVIKFKYKSATGNAIWVYFVKIYGSFPVDILRQLITFLDANGGTVTKVPSTAAITFPDFFVNIYNGLGTNLNTAFGVVGATSPGAPALQAAIDALCKVDYEWGNPARGALRSYFLEPTLFEQWTARNATPTLYSFTSATGEVVKFRADPTVYQKQQIIPPRLDTDTQPLSYPRDVFISGTTATWDATNPSIFVRGVQVGDVLSVHQEVFVIGTDATSPAAFQSISGSNIITSPTAAGNVFTSAMVGNMIFVPQGPDKGGYSVTQFIDGKNLALDRALTVSTPAILAQGVLASYTTAAGVDSCTSSTVDLTPYLNKYITMYGYNYVYQGSFNITAVNVGADIHKVNVDRGGAGHFVDDGLIAPHGFFVITAAPTTPPAVLGTATELYGLQSYRMYEGVPHDFAISAVTFTNPSTSSATIAAGARVGLMQPHRIYRSNVRRITPTEMSENQEGPFVYFDTQTVSMSPGTGANLDKKSYGTVDSGTYRSSGYTFLVDDNTLTYSAQETGTVSIPTRILPIGVADSVDAHLKLLGTPIQIQYEKADVVRQVQDFIDSPEDRVASANMLARHFLPAYVSYDASYVGAASTSVIAEDIRTYIDTIPVENALDVSVLEEKITDRGGNPDTPTQAMVSIHDWDRAVWLVIDENDVGGSSSPVPYNGTPRVTYFIPGEDQSGSTTGIGERIKLTKK